MSVKEKEKEKEKVGTSRKFTPFLSKVDPKMVPPKTSFAYLVRQSNILAPQTPLLLTCSLPITSDDQGPPLHGKAVPLRVPLPPIRLQLDVGSSRWKTEAGLKALLPPDCDELTTNFIS